ncbi:MAG: sulfatase [Candidatus Latescibacteria bacterium]|nr:sulfatase [Candidatus Latescibacterota bacterium]MBT7371988.1 sulfatase [Gammaproteobacteria bacterium]
MPTRPNLLFVFPDEMRQHAIGFAGQDPVITPNLDAFATESLALTNTVSNRPVCSPYRAMLLTGMYPHSNGVLTNCNSNTVSHMNYLREDDRCFTDVLCDNEYSQGYIGKWHLDPPSLQHEYTEGPREDGIVWDSFTTPERRHGIDFWYSYGCCDKHFDPHYWRTGATIEERIDPGEWSVKHETDVAIDYIRNPGARNRDPDKPFSLIISHNPPHMPFEQVPRKYVDQYGQASSESLLTRPNVDLDGEHGGDVAREHGKNYFGAITGVDDQFGRLLRCLDEEGLKEDTIVVFTSDHGEMMGSHGRYSKTIWYDESLLVPFIIRWPGHIQAGVDDLLLSTPDLMPTLLTMMGCADDIPNSVEGTDLSGAFLGSEYTRPESALYLNVDPEYPEGGLRGVRTRRYTFVIDRDRGRPDRYVLHDNQSDPYQLENVADERPETVRELVQELNGWLAKTGDPWLR